MAAAGFVLRLRGERQWAGPEPGLSRDSMAPLPLVTRQGAQGHPHAELMQPIGGALAIQRLKTIVPTQSTLVVRRMHQTVDSLLACLPVTRFPARHLFDEDPEENVRYAI